MDGAPDVPVEVLARARRRPHTLSIKRANKTELQRGREEYPETGYWRPTTRRDCEAIERPCPFVGCKYHLYLDVHPTRGSIKLNHPDLEPEDMTESCALDVADRGEHTLEQVGELVNLVRERVRQLEVAMQKRLQLGLQGWRNPTAADRVGTKQPPELEQLAQETEVTHV